MVFGIGKLVGDGTLLFARGCSDRHGTNERLNSRGSRSHLAKSMCHSIRSDPLWDIERDTDLHSAQYMFQLVSHSAARQPAQKTDFLSLERPETCCSRSKHATRLRRRGFAGGLREGGKPRVV